MSNTSPNQPQIDYWNGEASQRWIREQDQLDRVWGPLDELGMQRAAAAPGERVIDLGCGCGATTLLLADRVETAGMVLGIDVSAPMLARARERGRSRANIRWCQADAAQYAFTGDADLLYSRFGSMFFMEPQAAFRNLRSALRPAGRMCLVAWRAAAENPWYSLPLQAAAPLLPPAPVPPPNAPGPFAFASADYVRGILQAAGFAQIELEARDPLICMSTSGLAHAVDFAMNAGPLARLLPGVDDATKQRVAAAVKAVLADYADGDRVSLNAGIWIVTARR
jgi:SAM-dependent methyltransferase